MKKEYSKPNIVFEDFSLRANIAYGCAKEINGVPLFNENSCYIYGTKNDGNSCYFFDGGIQIFSTSVAEPCEFTPEDDLDQDGRAETISGICYEVPTDGLSVFGS